MLIEDDDQVRILTGSILRKSGYQVLEARSAAEGLRRSEAHAARIDLLLTDVVMPELSGPELAKRLMPMRPDMKLLFMSGYTDSGIVRHGVLLATTAFLAKPITVSSLTAKVREVLDAPAPAPLTE